MKSFESNPGIVTRFKTLWVYMYMSSFLYTKDEVIQHSIVQAQNILYTSPKDEKEKIIASSDI